MLCSQLEIMSSTHCLHNHVHSPSAGSVLVNNIIGFDDYARLPSFPGEYTDTPPPVRDKHLRLMAVRHDSPSCHDIASSPVEHLYGSLTIVGIFCPYWTWFWWFLTPSVCVHDARTFLYNSSCLQIDFSPMGVYESAVNRVRRRALSTFHFDSTSSPRP